MDCVFREFKRKSDKSLHFRYCNLNPNRIPGKFKGKSHTIDTKLKQAKSFTRKKELKSLKDLSSRTVSKIIQRMKLGCSICGWDEEVGDIHHIIPRSKGGSDNHNNMTYLCPNCHRLAHKKKLTKFVSIELQIGNTWKEFYYSKVIGN